MEDDIEFEVKMRKEALKGDGIDLFKHYLGMSGIRDFSKDQKKRINSFVAMMKADRTIKEAKK